MGDRLTVIDVAGRQLTAQEFTLIVDDQVQLEAKEPTHRGLASSCQTGKDLVPVDALIAANSQRCRIHERDARTAPEGAAKIDGQSDQRPRHQFDKALIAHQTWKFLVEVFLDVPSVVVLEIPIARLMEMDHDGHDFTQTHSGLPVATPHTAVQQMGLPLGLEFETEIIDITEQFE